MICMRSIKRLFCCVSAAALLVSPSIAARQSARPAYPATAKGPVADDYFGTKVADPYRWMENLDAPEVAAWVAAQNKVTFEYLEKLPMRRTLRDRIDSLFSYRRTALPEIQGGRLFYRMNDTGKLPQSPLYMRASLTAPATLVIDPNAISKTGDIALPATSASPDAKHVAYALSEGGADWEVLHVRDVESKKDLTDEVKWVRFSGISWTNDSRGFFYSRYPEPPKGKVFEAALSGQALYYHRLGTPQSEDALIYERKDLPTWFVGGAVTEDGRYLFVTLAKGSDNNNRLYYADLVEPAHPHVTAPIEPIVERDDAEFAPFGNRGPLVFVRSDLDAPNRKVLAIDVTHPEPAAWKTIVPEGQQAIETVALFGGRIVAEYLVDVQSRLSVYSTDGAAVGEIKLPGPGAVSGISGREDDSRMFFGFTSPLYPTTIFAYDLTSGTNRPFEAPQPPVDVSKYETKQLFAPSKDGTRVPLFMTARKDLPRDGNNPTMLYGYGGFSISTTPTYRSDVPAWLELGGVWVTANMRGGAEYGESWHKAGMLDKKQNVFDDFIAVAEYLIREKYTSPARLGIMGGSNGGLLVGAVEEQRPDLFAVALPAVGVMDMLRYDKFTGGKAWATEYGSSTDPQQFAYLIKYSPLQNVKPGTCYPATLATTADHDDRVVPSHTFKFIAAMQAAQACDKPILVRVETNVSHGYRPTEKRVAEAADLWAFTAENMAMK
jgi:prolyl oligopeptidase